MSRPPRQLAMLLVAAVPPSDLRARMTARFEAVTAQGQLDYGATYLRQLAYGFADPLAELPLSNLPENMQPHYRAALRRAATASGEQGSTEGDSDSDSSNDSDNDSSTDSGNDSDDVENDENDENDENRC
jgi:hypothetical protein